MKPFFKILSLEFEREGEERGAKILLDGIFR
jgi:hypothetical protein